MQADPRHCRAMLFESENLSVHCDAGVATLSLAFPGTRPNLLTSERLAEFERALECIESAVSIETLIIRSGKPAGFSAGAEPDCFGNIREGYEAREFAAVGQRVMSRVANAPFLTIALLHGPVHGAGLDLALSCDYRLAVARPDTTFGLPELRHGSLSPWGGLTRMIRIIGAAAAIEVITADMPLTAHEAQRIGLVDDAFSERRANIELRLFLDRQCGKPRRWRTPFDGWAARRVVAAYKPLLTASRQIALAAAVRLVPVAIVSETAGFMAERCAFAEVMQSAEARVARELREDELRMLEVHDAVAPAAIAVIGPLEPIANLILESLLRGSRVMKFDVGDGGNAAALEADLQVAIDRGRITPLEADQARGRFVRGSDEDRAALALITVDSASALELAESVALPNAPILSVNANIEAQSELCSRPRSLAGLNRAGTLAEIVCGPQFSESVLARAKSWLGMTGTPAVVVHDAPLVAPLLVAWWDEAVRLVADGLPIDLVDRAAKSLGARAGPLETLDGVGFDVAVEQVPRIRPLVAAGIHGRPHREGFYVLADDNPTCANAVAQLVLLEAANAKPAPRIAEPLSELDAESLCERRLTARLLAAVLKRMAHDPRITPAEVDLAITRGLGLFASRGGLLRHIDRRGLGYTVADFQTLQRRFGNRFKPPRGLARRAAAGETFHTAAGPFDAVLLKRSA